MDTSLRYSILPVIMLVIGLGNSFAQGGNAEPVWKKTVTRQVTFAVAKDPKAATAGANKGDITLIETLTKAIKAGTLTAYTNRDENFSTTLTIKGIKDIVDSKQDTVTIIDPVSNDETTKVRITNFDYSRIHTYRLLEEWTYYPNKGTTEIQIKGIAPIREIYGDDGMFRGIQAMFWLKYGDAIPSILKYEQAHKENSLTALIWGDHFKNKPTDATHAFALRIVNLHRRDDTMQHQLRNTVDDSTLQDWLLAGMMKGTIPAYIGTDWAMQNKLTISELNNTAGVSDTVTVLDPVSRKELEVVRPSSKFHVDGEIGLLEEWTYNMTTGSIQVKTTGIDLLITTYDGITKTTNHNADIRVRPNDARQPLTRYEQEQPTKSIPILVWDDYFINEGKPEVQR